MTVRTACGFGDMDDPSHTSLCLSCKAALRWERRTVHAEERTVVNPCEGCGTDLGPDVPPRPRRCIHCPPSPCPDCGRPDNAPCACLATEPADQPREGANQ